MSTSQGSTVAEGFGLTWRVKESLVTYLNRLSDGVAIVDGGAVRTADGGIVFPEAPGVDDGAGEARTSLEFTGSLILSGHDGLLHIAIEQPVIRLTGDSVELSCVDALTGERVAVAQAPVTDRREDDGGLFLEASPVALLESALELFAHQYPAGTVLAPLRVHVARFAD